MKLNIYSLYDSKTAQYGNPMFMINDGQVIRATADQVNTKEQGNMLHTHTEDFAVYKLGEFDTDTGVITAEAPTQLIAASALKQA